MGKLKNYLRDKEYCNKYVWVYTYNNTGGKVLLFSNKAKILNSTLGFTFLDCEVSNVEISYLSNDNLNKCDEIDITINYRG